MGKSEREREREREGFSAQRVLRSFRISRSSRKTGSKSFKISRRRRRRRREAKKKFFLHNSASDNNIKTLFPPPNICFCCAVVAIGVVAIVVVVRAFEPHSVYNSTTNGWQEVIGLVEKKLLRAEKKTSWNKKFRLFKQRRWMKHSAFSTTVIKCRAVCSMW